MVTRKTNEENTAPTPEVSTNPTGITKPLASDANPTGDPKVSTGPVGAPEVIEGQEHVLGDDPRRVAAQLDGGYHDSLSGRPVNEQGYFTDGADEGPVPPHRIVANDWPNQREKIDSPLKREGNEAS